MDDAPDYRYLNRGNRWLDFTCQGLEVGVDGALRLASLPMAAAPVPDLSALPEPDAPAGVAVTASGDVYFSDPAGHRVLVVDGCDATVRVALCGGGTGPNDLDTPRGLLYHPRRKALLVADSGAGRIDLYSLATRELAETWGGFDDPRSLATDPAGNVYVVDYGNHRVRKLDPLGRPRPDFWAQVRAHANLVPAEVAVTTVDATTLVVILDAATGRVYLVDTDGRPRGHWDSGLSRPMGLAASGATVYLGDNAQRRLFVFGPDGRQVGAAYGWAGPLAAVTVGPRGDLFVSSGHAQPPSRLAGSGAYRTHGLAWGGPFRNPSHRPEEWHLLRAALTETGSGAHARLYVCTQPDPPSVDPDAEYPFADPCWSRWPIMPDVAETLFPGEPLDTAWVGVEFHGEGLASPVLSQIRLDFAHDTYLRYLPALYGKDPESRQFLARWLTQFESAFDGEHEQVEGLAALFDPAAADARFLPWLAGWLAAPLPEQWDDQRKRQTIAHAFERYARRGTVAGILAALREEAGVAAVIEEPVVQTGWWALPADTPSEAEAELSVLGVSTVLAVAEPAGAVVGTTAVLDASFLTPQEAYATALFADVAHQFTVRLYRGKCFGDSVVAAVRATLDREAPAHTGYHVCVVEPRMRIGVQCRIGIDTVVGEPGAGATLDAAARGGLLVGGEPASRLGQRSQLGHIYLTDSPVDP